MKHVSILTLGLLASVPALLQPTELTAQATVAIGGGIVSSTLTGSDAEIQNAESETGLSFGAWLALPAGTRVSVVPGVHYVQKGVSVTEPGVGTAQIEVSYIEIPVLLSVSLTPATAPVGFSLFAGPSVSFEVGCTIGGEGGGVSVSVDCDPADQDERQTTDFGAIIGAGAQFPLTDALALVFSGGVDFGLRKLDTSADPSDEKLRAFFGSVALAFPVGG